MPSPFYNAIKGTTAGTPGTGAFTPNAASSGFLAWSTVTAGWVGLVRFEDGSAWELQYSYWNGTTLSRSATAQFVSSSTGSGLTLTSAATAALVVDGNELQPHLGTGRMRGWMAQNDGATITIIGVTAVTATGTAAGVGYATTNLLTEQIRLQYTSATTANAQAGWSHSRFFGTRSATAGRGGFEYVARFGASQIPTGPRVFIGATTTTFVGNTGEPSALVASYAVLGKDSGDTNLQFLCNDGTSTGTKIDTGLALTANDFYEVSIWCDPAGATVYMLLVNLATGAIYYGKTTTDVPAIGGTLMPNLVAGLSATTGTAVILHINSMFMTSGV